MTKEQLGKLIISSEDRLYRIAKSLLYNDADCADAIQDTIVKAFSNLHTLRNDLHVNTWIVRILMNECYSIMRQEKKLVSIESITETGSYETKDYSDLYIAIAKLPDEMRLVVALYYAEGFSVKEIAEIEDTTESAVKNRLYKARMKLRNMLDGEEAAQL